MSGVFTPPPHDARQKKAVRLPSFFPKNDTTFKKLGTALVRPPRSGAGRRRFCPGGPHRDEPPRGALDAVHPHRPASGLLYAPKVSKKKKKAERRSKSVSHLLTFRSPCHSSGLLTLVAPLDFEVSREHYLSVEGSRGKSSLSDITTVIINVTDVNDNAPVFGQGGYSVEITEDLTPGALVMKVRGGGADSCLYHLTHIPCLRWAGFNVTYTSRVQGAAAHTACVSTHVCEGATHNCE